MSYADRAIVRDLIKAWLRVELELEELCDQIVLHFRGEVMPTTPPEGGT